MRDTKMQLLEKNGCRCMLCGREVSYKEINWHHIVPKYVSKSRGEKPDDSYENGSLLCVRCHAYVHTFFYEQWEYQDLMQIILSHKK